MRVFDILGYPHNASDAQKKLEKHGKVAQFFDHANDFIECILRFISTVSIYYGGAFFCDERYLLKRLETPRLLAANKEYVNPMTTWTEFELT